MNNTLIAIRSEQQHCYNPMYVCVSHVNDVKLLTYLGKALHTMSLESFLQ